MSPTVRRADSTPSRRRDRLPGVTPPTLAHRGATASALSGDSRKHRDRSAGAVDRPAAPSSIRRAMSQPRHIYASTRRRRRPVAARLRRSRLRCSRRAAARPRYAPRDRRARPQALSRPAAARTPAGRAAARRPRRGRPARRAAGRRSPASPSPGGGGSSGMSGSSGVIGVSLMPRSATRSSAGAPHACSTSGTATEPSSRWSFSSSAIMWRQVTAVPLSVATWRGRPSGPAVADVEPPRLEVGRVRGRGDLAVALLARAARPRSRTSSRPRRRGRRPRC